MATSEVNICNSGLIKVGAATITALTDVSKSGEICNLMYSIVRDDELSSHPWNFATKRIELAQDVEDPLFDFAYQFVLPSDVLRILTDDDLDEDADWVREGDKILSDSSTMNIKYIYRVTDVQLFPPYFCELLSYRLAKETAYAFTQSAALADILDKNYQKKLALARSFDGQESAAKLFKAQDWTAVRR